MKSKILTNKNKVYRINSQELHKNTTHYLKKTSTIGLSSPYFSKIEKHYGIRTKKTEILTTCNLTGRTKGPIKQYNLSRISFRELIQKGLLTGVRKYYW